MSSWSEHVFPHGELVELAPRLWYVSGSLKRPFIPRNMLIYRLDGGGLLIHSAVALDDAGMQALEALGRPSILVVPNRMHRADASVYKERYPALQVCCPQGARAKVEEVVPVDIIDDDLLPEHGIVVHAPAGDFENIYELPLDDGVALVCADTVFHLDHMPGLSGFMARYITRSTGFFGVTGLGRFFLGKGVKRLKAWLEQQCERDDVRVFSMGHGDPLTDGIPGHLRDAAARL